jgi:deazaflavin-dependent oxidoreductase (nitroreductase family)
MAGMPSDFAFKSMNAVHRALLKISGGRLGWKVANMPVLELSTTGRRSGLPHTVMLTSPVQDGTTLVVVASRGGDDKPPAWFVNLRANPDVEVRVHGKPKQRMRADIATPEERGRLWPVLTAGHKNYAGYQAKTTREIPLVLLRPQP